MCRKAVWMAAVFCAALAIAGCTAGEGRAAQQEDPGPAVLQGAPGPEGDGGEEHILTLKIVDGAQTGELVLAGQGKADVYTLSVGDIPVYLDGEPEDAGKLEDGMPVELSFSGAVEDTWPAGLEEVFSISACSLGTEKNPGGGNYDLCGLYLKVLEDLWETDEGLNGDIRYISVDLSQAPGGLTEGEREAVAWLFCCGHGAEMLTLSYQELVEQGYCDRYGWEDGILFSIAPHETEKEEIFSLPAVRFDAEKWRSGLGAYFFYDCSAVWPELGSWSGYSVGSHMIS